MRTRFFIIYPRVFLWCSAGVCETGRRRGAAEASQERRARLIYNYCTCVSGEWVLAVGLLRCVGKHQREKRIVSSLSDPLDSFAFDSLNTTVEQVFIFEHCRRCLQTHVFSQTEWFFFKFGCSLLFCQQTTLLHLKVILVDIKLSL